MRKASTPTVSVTVGRFNAPTQVISVPQDSDIATVLHSANITLNEGEQIFIGGVLATSADIVDDQDLLQIVAPKEAGNLNLNR